MLNSLNYRQTFHLSGLAGKIIVSDSPDAVDTNFTQFILRGETEPVFINGVVPFLLALRAPEIV